MNHLSLTHLLHYQHLTLRTIKHLPKHLPSSLLQTQPRKHLSQVKVTKFVLESIPQAAIHVSEHNIHFLLFWEDKLCYFLRQSKLECHWILHWSVFELFLTFFHLSFLLSHHKFLLFFLLFFLYHFSLHFFIFKVLFGQKRRMIIKDRFRLCWKLID